MTPGEACLIAVQAIKFMRKHIYDCEFLMVHHDPAVAPTQIIQDTKDRLDQAGLLLEDLSTEEYS